MNVLEFSHKKHQWRNTALRLLDQCDKLPEPRFIAKFTRPERDRLYTLARRLQATLIKGEALLHWLKKVPYKDSSRPEGEVRDLLAQLIDAMTTLEDYAVALNLTRFPTMYTKTQDASESKVAKVSKQNEDAVEALAALISEEN